MVASFSGREFCVCVELMKWSSSNPIHASVALEHAFAGQASLTTEAELHTIGLHTATRRREREGKAVTSG